MRFSAIVLGAAALVSGVVASPQDSYNSITSATQVVTITRTVSRVVQTEYATKTPSAYPTTTKTPSSHAPAPTGVLPPPYAGNNGTTPSAPTGALPSPSSPESSPIYSGAATHMGIESLGAAAVAGIIGFMAI